MIPITPQGKHASRQSKQTLQTLTRQLHREIQSCKETLHLLSAGPRRQASARTSAESDEVCQRKTKDRADGMREKKCPLPSTGFEPVPLGYAPIVIPITPRGQARLASVETNTSDTHPPTPSCVYVCVCMRACVSVCMRACVCVYMCTCMQACVD